MTTLIMRLEEWMREMQAEKEVEKPEWLLTRWRWNSKVMKQQWNERLCQVDGELQVSTQILQ